jgi:hypothetical protein
MSYTERFSEVHYPLVNVPPGVKSATSEVVSAYVSLANYHRAVLVIHTGAIAASGTVVVRLIQAKDTGGTTPIGIPTTSTQDKLTSTLTTADANSVIVIELRTEELSVNLGYECVAIGYDVDTDTVAMSAILYGVEPRFAPVPTTNYNEIVP